MPLIKVAYFMLNFLNLKSFLLNLFFAVASSLSTLCGWNRVSLSTEIWGAVTQCPPVTDGPAVSHPRIIAVQTSATPSRDGGRLQNSKGTPNLYNICI